MMNHRALTNIKKSGLAALFLCVLGGCQSRPDDGVSGSFSLGGFLQTPYEKLEQFAAENGGEVFTAAGTPFKLTSVQSTQNLRFNASSSELTVYIEGDGRAWLTPTMPSNDPSPRSYMMVKHALADSHPAVYLARPCQFQKTESPSCTSNLWTTERFSKVVIESYGLALDQLKLQRGVSRFHLVGYSGGGAVAMALAGQRADVERVVTLAGNVDPQAWIQRHNLSSLGDVVNPLDYAGRLSRIPQRHYVGLKDKVVPPDLAKAFASKIGASCADIVELQASHEDGWGAISETELNRAINCHQPVEF